MGLGTKRIDGVRLGKAPEIQIPTSLHYWALQNQPSAAKLILSSTVEQPWLLEWSITFNYRHC